MLGLVVACSDLGGLSDEPAALDAGTSKDSGKTDTPGESDGGPTPEGPRCDRTKPFEAPALVTEFDPTSNYVKGAIASPDELEVFYLRYTTSGNWDLRHARRATKSDPWGPVENLPLTPTPDAYLSLTAGGLKLYFWTLESPYRATRLGTNDMFGIPTKFDVASGPGMFVVNADDFAYFAKYENMDGGGTERFIRRGALSTSGFSSTSVIVPNIHRAGSNDDRPILNTSETVMYFASNRPGGKGLADIWVSRRSSKSEELGAPVHVPELSTEKVDGVTWVSDDECEVFLDRANHIYHARRPN